MAYKSSNTLHNITQIDSWLKRNDYNYYSINSLPKNDIIEPLLSKYKRFGVIWRQIFRISPINFRSLFGKKSEQKNPKAIILIALAYLELWNTYKKKDYFSGFETCLNWIISHRSKHTKNFAIPQLKQIYVVGYTACEEDISPFLTYWAGILFLQAYKYTNESYYLDLAKSTGNYFINELPRIDTKKFIYFYYVPNHSKNSRCYNCSALISSFLIKLSEVSKEPKYRKYGEKGILYIVDKQNKDGSWFYANSNKGRYVDNFHTGFMLLAVYVSQKYNNNSLLKNSLNSGLEYYENRLFKILSNKLTKPIHFDPDHLPLNSNLIQDVDLRDSALSIILFSILSQKNEKFLENAVNILEWTQKKMRGKNGYYCEITWGWTNRIPYIEFQAWMFLALAIYNKIIIQKEKTNYDKKH